MRRYDGNTGRYVYIPDRPAAEPVSRTLSQKQPTAQPEVEPTVKQQTPPPNPFGGGIQKLFSNLFAQGFEVEDLLLFAILFLMYQETKDKELLIIMGSMFLL